MNTDYTVTSLHPMYASQSVSDSLLTDAAALCALITDNFSGPGGAIGPVCVCVLEQ